jgi:hypothetical protein
MKTMHRKILKLDLLIWDKYKNKKSAKQKRYKERLALNAKKYLMEWRKSHNDR